MSVDKNRLSDPWTQLAFLSFAFITKGKQIQQTCTGTLRSSWQGWVAGWLGQTQLDAVTQREAESMDTNSV